MIEKKLKLYIPQLSEMSFRQKLLSDEDTMLYNKKWGGIIDFPKEKWEETYFRLINDDVDSFYSYIYSEEEKAFIGEASYKFDDELKEYIINIIVHNKYRNKGYGTYALSLLCEKAKSNGICSLSDNIALDNYSINIFLKQGFKEIYRNSEYILVKKYL